MISLQPESCLCVLMNLAVPFPDVLALDLGIYSQAVASQCPGALHKAGGTAEHFK